MTPDRQAAGAVLIRTLQEELGASVIQTPGEADFARHLRDFTNEAPQGLQLLGIAYPHTTEQVAHILRACHAANVPVTPQGGLTGIAGGAVPVVPSLVLSLERMRGIEELDTNARTMTVLAGTVLETVQNAAEEADLFFPLDLGGRGTAQIGGNAATNAGGNRVLRYGMMRDLVLGLEVVLADGTVVSSLNKMLKNNAGYDLKNLFIGSEGTLGIITRLVLRLFPKPRSAVTGLVAVADYAALLELLRAASSAFGATLGAFEVMWPEFYRLGTTALGRTPPLPEGHGIYVLLETLGTDPQRDETRFQEVIAELLDSGLLQDAVVAGSGRQRQELWAIRDCPGEFPKVGHWPQLGFDVSLPAGRIGDFVEHSRRLLQEHRPDLACVYFGHLADSNLHLSVRVPEQASPAEIEAIEELVYRAVGEWGGSISAEHGIGLLKRAFLHYSRSPAEMELMRAFKRTLDPKGILNPGKVI